MIKELDISSASFETTPGLCLCGCGGYVGFYPNNNRWKGWVKGAPKRFLKGHIQRLTRNPYRRNETDIARITVAVLGRPLPKGAVVHHVNRKPWDNRNENLVICQDTAYHRLLHMRMTAHEASGHADWRKCRFCPTWSPPSELIFQKQGMPYHRACSAENARRQKRRAKEIKEQKRGSRK